MQICLKNGILLESRIWNISTTTSYADEHGPQSMNLTDCDALTFCDMSPQLFSLD